MLLLLNQDLYKIYFHVHMLQNDVYVQILIYQHLVDVVLMLMLQDHPMVQLDVHVINQYEIVQQLQLFVLDNLSSI